MGLGLSLRLSKIDFEIFKTFTSHNWLVQLIVSALLGIGKQLPTFHLRT